MADEHVSVRELAHMLGGPDRPRLRYAIEMRERPGPAFKEGVYDNDTVWIQLRGGLIVAKARVTIAFRGEYSRVDDIRRRVTDASIAESFWSGRTRHGYAIVATLQQEQWIEPYWAGPRTYGYEWIVLESEKKRASWLEEKEPPRDGDGLLRDFAAARARGFAPEEAS